MNTNNEFRQLRWTLYTKMCWGLLILFGLVGSLSGHREGALAVFLITTIVWTCVRILAEGLEAGRQLVIDNLQRKKDAKAPPKNNDDNGPTLPPPNAVA